MAPAAKAFHNQRPHAIAATGFPQSAATGHCSHRPAQLVRAPRRAADRMDPAAMTRSSKAIRKAVTYRHHRRRRPRPHPLRFSLKSATGPSNCIKTTTRLQALPPAAVGHAVLRTFGDGSSSTSHRLRTFGDGSYAHVLIDSIGHRPRSAPEPQALQRCHRPQARRLHQLHRPRSSQHLEPQAPQPYHRP